MPIAAIAYKFKNTHDLAGVAEAIRDSGLRSEFEWGEAPMGTVALDARTAGELFESRKMNCYEFVHFCAYLCSSHKTVGPGSQHGVGIPLIKIADSGVVKKPYFTIPAMHMNGVRSISRGALVVGVKTTGNNRAGFFHIGICIGKDEVIHLINAGYPWEDDLKSAPLKDWFSPKTYKELWIASYNWNSVGDLFVGPAPSYFLAKRDSDAIAAVTASSTTNR
jgi:hypothetical protein